jgi:hypothetical protein
MGRSASTDADSDPNAGWIVVLSMVVIVALMAVFYFYPYPDGKRPSFGSFVLFWLKEIIALALFTVAGVALLIARLINRHDGKSGDAV